VTWQTDPLSQKQREFLTKLGVVEMPRTKGEGSRLIDNILRTKHGNQHKSPCLKLYKPKDVNTRVDEAAERAKKELDENSTSHHRRTPANGTAISHFRVVGLDWTDASHKDGSGQHDPPRTQSDRGEGAIEAQTNEDAHRSDHVAEERA
jgi:hypothetical protein